MEATVTVPRILKVTVTDDTLLVEPRGRTFRRRPARLVSARGDRHDGGNAPTCKSAVRVTVCTGPISTRMLVLKV